MPLDEPELARLIDALCREFELDWQNHRQPSIEHLLTRIEDGHREALLVELIALERELLASRGETGRLEDYQARFPLWPSAVNRGCDSISRSRFHSLDEPSEAVTLAPIPIADLDITEAPTIAPRNGPSLEPTAYFPAGQVIPETLRDDPTIDFREPRPSTDRSLGTVRYFGDYELLSEIARGGMGVVYRARQVSLNRPVALKMILAGQLAGADDIKRFHIEAEAAANLDHPGIVPIYEIGEHDDQHFFSMGFVEGSSLSARVADGPLPPRDAADLTRQVALAMQYAHEKGVIHRDLKPGNVLLDSQGRPKVTDFGLAKKLQGDSGLTHTGQIMGTPSYMPPEQAEGKDVGPLADVYSLGAILYCLLTGRPPFQASLPMDTLLQVIGQEPVPVRQLVPSVPRDLETIALKALAKDPHRRYESAEALADDLGRWLRDEPIIARPVGRLEKVAKLCRRNPIVASLATSLVMALVLGTAVATLFAFRAGRNAELARGSAREALTNLELANVETERARAEKRLADRRLYGAEMTLGQQAFVEGAMTLVAEHLDNQRPSSPGAADLRGFEWYYLDRIRSGELRTFGDNAGGVLAVAYSPDGRTIAIGGPDKIIKLRDARTGQIIRTFTGHTGRLDKLAFSPDGKWLASAASDGMVFIEGEVRTPDLDNNVRLWDVTTGKEISTFRIKLESIGGLAFSPDGNLLAFGSSDHSVQLWDIASGKLAGKLTGHTQLVSTVAISADGRWVASGDAGRTVKLWDLTSKREVRTLNGHTDWIHSVAFSRDGRILASAGQDKTIKLWEVESGRELATCRGHRDSVRSVAFGPDGQTIASASVDQLVKVWSVESSKELRNLRGHTAPVWDLTYNPDGWTIASASFDGTVKVWDANWDVTGLRLKNSGGGNRMSTMPSGLAFSPDSRTIAVSYLEGNVVLRDAETGIDRLTIYANFQPKVVSFHPDGKWLATASIDRAIRLWDLATGRELGAFFGHREPISSLAFSPDGRMMVSGSEDGSVRLWDVETKRCRPLIENRREPILSVAFAHDGKTVASGGSDQKVHLWDVASGGALATFTGLTGFVYGVAFHPSEPKLAASDGKTIRIWKTTTGQEIGVCKGHIGTSVAFSPDGNRLISGGEPLGGLAISNDGRRIGTTFGTTTIGLWDVVTGQEVATLQGDRDGGNLDADMNIVRIWDASPWTPAGRIDQEALGLFLSMTSENRPVAEIVRRIQALDTIDEPVRRRALELTAASEESRQAAEAEALLQPLFATEFLREDVQKKLREQTGLKEELRTRALDLSERYRVDPNTLLNYAWLMTLNASPQATRYYPKALRMAEEARRIVPDDGLSLTILGAAQYRIGQDRQAIETLNRAERQTDWIGRRWESPSLGFLGDQFRAMTRNQRNLPGVAFQVLAHVRLGELPEALQGWDQLNALKTSIPIRKASPIESLLNEVDQQLAKLGDADPRLIALDAQLAAILRGEVQPKSNQERLELAQKAYDHARHAAAAKLWSGAVEADPKLAEDRQAQVLYNAGCAAALAGSGHGKDKPALDDAAKAKLRDQARSWLLAELAAWTRSDKAMPPGPRPLIVQTLKHWKEDQDLAGVREARSLEALPEAERESWRALWAGVDSLLARVGSAQAPDNR